MNKKKEDSKPKKRDPNAIEVKSSKPECEFEKEAIVAQTYLRPTVMAATMIKGRYSNDDDVNINALISELNTQVALVQEGKMGRAEEMLISQAHTLDALFAELISRARINMGDYFHATCKYMNMAFKAQSQCRTTLEALAEIKNPRPVAFIRQQNVGENVQVNNGQTPARAEENSKSTNRLLTDGSKDYETVDFGRTETAGGNDKDLETVGAKLRAKDE